MKTIIALGGVVVAIALVLAGRCALGDAPIDDNAVQETARQLERARGAAGSAYEKDGEGKKLYLTWQDARKQSDAAEQAHAPNAGALKQVKYKAEREFFLAESRAVSIDPRVVAAEASSLRARGLIPALDEKLGGAAAGSAEERQRHTEDAVLVFKRRLEERQSKLTAVKEGRIEPALAKDPGHPLYQTVGDAYIFSSQESKDAEVALQQHFVDQLEGDLRSAKEHGFPPEGK